MLYYLIKYNLNVMFCVIDFEFAGISLLLYFVMKCNLKALFVLVAIQMVCMDII